MDVIVASGTVAVMTWVCPSTSTVCVVTDPGSVKVMMATSMPVGEAPKDGVTVTTWIALWLMVTVDVDTEGSRIDSCVMTLPPTVVIAVVTEAGCVIPKVMISTPVPPTPAPAPAPAGFTVVVVNAVSVTMTVVEADVDSDAATPWLTVVVTVSVTVDATAATSAELPAISFAPES